MICGVIYYDKTQGQGRHGNIAVDQVEDKSGRAKNVKKLKWHHALDNDMKELNKKE